MSGKQKKNFDIAHESREWESGSNITLTHHPDVNGGSGLETSVRVSTTNQSGCISDIDLSSGLRASWS